MIYLAYYSKPGQPFLQKLISRGFACTPQELPREIQTRCGGPLYRYEMYSTVEAARTVMEHNKPEWKEET